MEMWFPSNSTGSEIQHLPQLPPQLNSGWALIVCLWFTTLDFWSGFEIIFSLMKCRLIIFLHGICIDNVDSHQSALVNIVIYNTIVLFTSSAAKKDTIFTLDSNMYTPSIVLCATVKFVIVVERWPRQINHNISTFYAVSHIFSQKGNFNLVLDLFKI